MHTALRAEGKVLYRFPCSYSPSCTKGNNVNEETPDCTNKEK